MPSLASRFAFQAVPVAQLAGLIVVPVWLLPMGEVYGWALLLPVLLTNTWWAMQHEAMHGLLPGGRRANRLYGRVNAVLFGAPFDLLRRGHLLHHAYSRTPRERSEVYEAGIDSRPGFTLGYYGRLLGGLYVMEVLAGVLLLLPRAWLMRWVARLASERNLVAAIADKLLQPRELANARRDVILLLVLHVGAFALYGSNAWMLALALAGRGLLVSLMDNAYHYGTPLDDTRFARDLRLPLKLSGLILHFNLHGTHHARPGMAWHTLPALHRQRGGAFQGQLVDALLAQLRGPIEAGALRTRAG